MMKNIFTILCSLLLLISVAALAQDEGQQEDVPDHRPVRQPFESTWLIDNQTTVVPAHKTFQFDIQHRFGSVENGFEDLFGLYAPSNIRLGLSYVLMPDLMVGFGFAKDQKPVDFNLKYAVIKQTRSDKIPVSVTYFGNAVIDTRDAEFFINTSDRYSYFHQVIISRRFTPKLSVQAAPSLSHMNIVSETRSNDHFAAAFGARYRITGQSSVLVNYDQPITKHTAGNPNPNISFGIEVSTSSHAFQIFAGNYRALLPQYNNFFNSYDYQDGEFVIGFNITRLWNF